MKLILEFIPVGKKEIRSLAMSFWGLEEKIQASANAGKIEIQKRAALYFFNLGAKLRCTKSLVRKEFWAKKQAKNRLKTELTWLIFELELEHIFVPLYEQYSDPPIKSF